MSKGPEGRQDDIFGEWKGTPHSQSEKAKGGQGGDKPGDIGRGQTLLGLVGQGRELGLYHFEHG